jgi:hypothetical protein
MSPTRDFSIEISAAITVPLVPGLRLAVSTTQCLVEANIRFVFDELRCASGQPETIGVYIDGMGSDFPLCWFD